VDGYVTEDYPMTDMEYNKYIDELYDKQWWLWWKNGC
jgi:hypothetical protein